MSAIPLIKDYASVMDAISGLIFNSMKNEKTILLGNVACISNGSGDVQDSDSIKRDGWYPFFDRSEEQKWFPTYSFNREAIIYAGEGQNFFPRYYKGKFALHQRCYAITDFCECLLPKYCLYFMNTLNSYFIRNAVGSTVPSLRMDMFQKAKIKIPTIERQQEIVSTLDALSLKCENEEIVITDLLTAEMSRKLSDEVIEQAILTSKSDNVDYIPSDITLSTADMFLATAIGREMILRRLLLHKVFDRYDYILIDCLPSLGVLVVNALVAADGVLIPVQTQKFALNGIVQFEEIMTLAKELNPTLTLYGVIETMNDNTRMAKAVDEALTERYGNLVFNSRISKSVMASNSTAEQRAMTINTKLGSQYADLTNEFIGRCK